jgi:hypothetical protein
MFRRVRCSRTPRASSVIGWALGLATFAYLMAFPPHINEADESFILYGAKRILNGEALYRDIFEFLAPGAFYFYALAYAVGGTSVTAERLATAFLNSTSSMLTYFLALHVASEPEAILAGLFVAVACVPTWDMASHHWIGTTLSLATAAALLSTRLRDSTRLRPALAGLFTGLLVCSHQGRGMWVIGWLAVTLPALVWAGPPGHRVRRCIRELVYAALAGAIVSVAILGFAIWKASLHEMIYATYTWVVSSYGPYHLGWMRWAGLTPFADGGRRFTWLWLLRVIPWILSVEAVLVPIAMWRHGVRTQLVRLALLLLAAVSAISIFYWPDFVHVAFIAPFSMIVLAGLVHRAASASRLRRFRLTVPALRLGWCALLLALVLKARSNLVLSREDNPIILPTAFGVIAGTDRYAQTLSELHEILGPSEKPPHLLSYPTEAWVYLTLPADNPTPFSLLRRGYSTPAQFRQAIDRLEHDPAAMVLVNRAFADADDPMMKFIKTRYREVARVGPRILAGTPLFTLYGRADGRDG